MRSDRAPARVGSISRARLLMSTLFLLSGFGKLTAVAATQAYMAPMASGICSGPLPPGGRPGSSCCWASGFARSGWCWPAGA